MPEPQDRVIDLIYSRWRSQILYAGVKAGVFEAIGSQPKSSTAIAQELGLDSALLYRLMRALASLGLANELPDRQFTISPDGAVLRGDHPKSLHGLALLVEGSEHYAIWKHLPAILQDGVQNGFIREYGHPAFEYTVLEPSYGAAFDSGMSSHSRLQTAWVLDALSSYDFSQFSTLCDVGGGQGHLLCHFLQKYPHLQGVVLERPAVLADKGALWSERLGVADRCEYLTGDMFVDVPPADAYLMKLILHDWNDAECAQILRVIKKRASPSGRVFIIEHVIPDASTPHFSKLFDIHMMVWGSGRERTTDEYAALLDEAGWRFIAKWAPSSGSIGGIEGAAAAL